jgi:hypothetical protein
MYGCFEVNSRTTPRYTGALDDQADLNLLDGPPATIIMVYIAERHVHNILSLERGYLVGILESPRLSTFIRYDAMITQYVSIESILATPHTGKGTQTAKQNGQMIWSRTDHGGFCEVCVHPERHQ